MDSRPSSTYPPARTAFLIGVPLCWALLLLFHPTSGDTYYELIDGNVARWEIVHIGSLVFIALFGVAIYLLVQPLKGRAATVARCAVPVFILFYAVFEGVVGIANGLLVHWADGRSPADQAVVADAMEYVSRDSALFGDLGVIAGLGSLGWVVAVVAAALAFHRAGAPRAVPWLLGLSAIATIHPPPTGPLGLALFAAAVALLVRAPAPAVTVAPTPAGS